jgi:hypothetical protein
LLRRTVLALGMLSAGHARAKIFFLAGTKELLTLMCVASEPS